MEVVIALMPVEEEVPGTVDPAPPILWMKICDPDTVVPIPRPEPTYAC